MFLRWVFPDPSAAEQFFEAIGLGAIVVTGKIGYESAFPETTGTQEDRGIIILQSGDKVRFIHIIEFTLP